jgi:uncharacterized protein with NAD-binding domain and iron-sulfur cluster
MGTFLYPNFRRLPLQDRLSALPLLYSVIDFDNSDAAWRRYDKMTARELFHMFGVSKRLYKEAFEPMLLVGLFAPGEECSAAGASWSCRELFTRICVLLFVRFFR